LPRKIAVPLAAICLVLAIGAGLLLLRDDASTSLRPSKMTAEELYASVDEKLAAINDVLYFEVESEVESVYKANSRGELWLFGRNDRVRQHIELSVEFEENRSIHQSMMLTTPEERFTLDDDGDSKVVSSRFWQCYDATVVASSLLGCEGPTTEMARHVEEGTLRGRDVVVLVEEGTSRDSDRTIRSKSWLYLDARTLMPIEGRSEGNYESDPSAPIRGITRFSEPKRLALSDLGADFFEPSGIGYVASDPLAAVRSVNDLQVYWLGPELTLPDGQTIFLRSSYQAPEPGRPYRLSLLYATKDAPHEPPTLSLMVFHRDMWERSPAIASQAVTLGDVVVFVQSQALPNQRTLLASPGNLEFILSQLRPFEP
jgi:hypothetical protein